MASNNNNDTPNNDTPEAIVARVAAAAHLENSIDPDSDRAVMARVALETVIRQLPAAARTPRELGALLLGAVPGPDELLAAYVTAIRDLTQVTAVLRRLSQDEDAPDDAVAGAEDDVNNAHKRRQGLRAELCRRLQVVPGEVDLQAAEWGLREIKLQKDMRDLGEQMEN